MRRILRFTFFAIIILIVAMFVKTFLTISVQVKYKWQGEAGIDRDAVQRLSEAIQFKTVSYDDSSDGQLKCKELKAFIVWIKKSYPNCIQNSEIKIFNPGSILFTFKGVDETLKPALFLAHLDVVPADDTAKKMWKFNPFSGEIRNDTIYGRGTIDDKSIATAMLEALEKLIKKGLKHKRTILFAFGHDEETGGKNGAAQMATYLEQNKIAAEFIADEGFGVLESMVPGISKPVAVIGVAEKGFLSLNLKVELNGGHSSMPKTETAITKLSAAINLLNKNGFEYTFCEPMKEFFTNLAPEMNFGYKFLFSNLWITSPLVKMVLKGNEKTAATIHTTIATTKLFSGIKDNVVPKNAEATFNFRILPGESISSVEAHVKKVLYGLNIAISRNSDFNEPSPVSPSSGVGYEAIYASAAETFKDVLITSGLVIAGTDTKNYARISTNIYRFVPLRLNQNNIGTIHGENEKIAAKNYCEAIFYYQRLFGKM